MVSFLLWNVQSQVTILFYFKTALELACKNLAVPSRLNLSGSSFAVILWTKRRSTLISHDNVLPLSLNLSSHKNFARIYSTVSFSSLQSEHVLEHVFDQTKGMVWSNTQEWQYLATFNTAAFCKQIKLTSPFFLLNQSDPIWKNFGHNEMLGGVWNTGQMLHTLHRTNLLKYPVLQYRGAQLDHYTKMLQGFWNTPIWSFYWLSWYTLTWSLYLSVLKYTNLIFVLKCLEIH